MGLFLGMSLVSVIELATFLWKITWIFISKKRREHMVKIYLSFCFRIFAAAFFASASVFYLLQFLFHFHFCFSFLFLLLFFILLHFTILLHFRYFCFCFIFTRFTLLQFLLLLPFPSYASFISF